MATYVDEVLQPGETVRYSGTLHWIIFLPGIALLAFGVAGLAAMVTMNAGYSFHVYSMLVYFALAIGAVQLLSAWVLRLTTEIAVTDRRVIYKTGLVSRRSVEMNMDKVESVDVTQDVFGRLFDYGTVLIRGTGAGLEPLSNIASPVALRNAITAR